MLQLGKYRTRFEEFLANTDFKTCQLNHVGSEQKKVKIFSAPLTDIYKKNKIITTIWLDGCNN